MKQKDVDQQMAMAGVERTSAGVELEGRFWCIIPQEDVTITSITPLQGLTSTNYNADTLARGIPFYLAFRKVTLTGAADCYKASSKALIEKFKAEETSS